MLQGSPAHVLLQNSSPEYVGSLKGPGKVRLHPEHGSCKAQQPGIGFVKRSRPNTAAARQQPGIGSVKGPEPVSATQSKAAQGTAEYGSSASSSPEKGADSQTAPAEELPAEKPAGETGMLQKQHQLSLCLPRPERPWTAWPNTSRNTCRTS